MRIVDVRECSVPISRYDDPAVALGELTTSPVAVVTDVVRHGRPVVGYGFASVGRFAQGGLIRERFVPRLLNAMELALLDDEGKNLDPFRAWTVMMTGEKPGGHGERCVAVGYARHGDLGCRREDRRTSALPIPGATARARRLEKLNCRRLPELASNCGSRRGDCLKRPPRTAPPGRGRRVSHSKSSPAGSQKCGFWLTIS